MDDENDIAMAQNASGELLQADIPLQCDTFVPKPHWATFRRIDDADTLLSLLFSFSYAHYYSERDLGYLKSNCMRYIHQSIVGHLWIKNRIGYVDKRQTRKDLSFLLDFLRGYKLQCYYKAYEEDPEGFAGEEIYLAFFQLDELRPKDVLLNTGDLQLFWQD